MSSALGPSPAETHAAPDAWRGADSEGLQTRPQLACASALTTPYTISFPPRHCEVGSMPVLASTRSRQRISVPESQAWGQEGDVDGPRVQMHNRVSSDLSLYCDKLPFCASSMAQD